MNFRLAMLIAIGPSGGGHAHCASPHQSANAATSPRSFPPAFRENHPAGTWGERRRVHRRERRWTRCTAAKATTKERLGRYRFSCERFRTGITKDAGNRGRPVVGAPWSSNATEAHRSCCCRNSLVPCCCDEVVALFAQFP